MIIFGTRRRVSKKHKEGFLEGACPDCDGNLVFGKLRDWFTLYFIPIFPYNSVENLYECLSCKSTYKESVKDKVFTSKDKANLALELSRHSDLTTVACLAHLAMADDNFDSSERIILDGLFDKVIHERNKEECRELFNRIIDDKDKEIAHKFLLEAREYLTEEYIKNLLVLSMSIVASDGEVTKQEEESLKEILLIMGFPKSVFDEAIQDVNSKNKR